MDEAVGACPGYPAGQAYFLVDDLDSPQNLTARQGQQLSVSNVFQDVHSLWQNE